MAFHISKPETDALARELAAVKKVGLTKAVHEALLHELEWLEKQHSLVERSVAFARELRVKGDPEKGLPADRDFLDNLYED
jgi:antitoxin VapB